MRTQAKKAIEIDERRKKNASDRRGQRDRAGKEKERGEREEGAVRNGEKDVRDTRIFLRRATLSGQTRGRLILLHVMQISRECCPPASRAGSCLAGDPCVVSRQVRRDDHPPPRFDTIGGVAFINGICDVYY